MRFFVKVILVLLSFFVSAMSFAQEDSEGEGKDDASLLHHYVVLKFSPLAMIELPRPSFQVALEYPVGKSFSIQHELGWLPPVAFRYAIAESQTPLNGGKFKTELRHYLLDAPSPTSNPTDYHSNFLPRRNYLALEGVYVVKGVRNKDWRIANNSAYYQWEEWDEIRSSLAFHVKYGIQVYLSGSRKILIDSYAGLGLRQYFESHRLLPGASGSVDNLPPSNRYLLPSLALGFKIGLGL